MTKEEIASEVRRQKAERMRIWRKRNPDKVREASKRYWERRAIKALENRTGKEEACDGTK